MERKNIRNGKALLAGRWRITKMNMWDKGFCDTQVKAFIVIEKGGGGSFQFGLVCGEVNGEFSSADKGALFDFTWEGSDECDAVSGDGWLQSSNGKNAEGEIRFHGGDKSHFWAKKAGRQ